MTTLAMADGVPLLRYARPIGSQVADTVVLRTMRAQGVLGERMGAVHAGGVRDRWSGRRSGGARPCARCLRTAIVVGCPEALAAVKPLICRATEATGLPALPVLPVPGHLIANLSSGHLPRVLPSGTVVAMTRKVLLVPSVCRAPGVHLLRQIPGPIPCMRLVPARRGLSDRVADASARLLSHAKASSTKRRTRIPGGGARTKSRWAGLPPGRTVSGPG
ncbi:hypothetical protein GCM10010278_75760 [Streptomyces melanogenes]|nr:hypothetical protein GCM10010278_75760 [Streptomyces melanogenes]